MQIENFKILLEGNHHENINIDTLFEEFKFLFTSAHKDFKFDLGDTWLDGDYLNLGMEAKLSNDRYLRLTYDNNGSPCIDAYKGNEIEMTAKIYKPYGDFFPSYIKQVGHIVLDFLNKHYGTYHDGWYKE